jgi:hypothetical protein
MSDKKTTVRFARQAQTRPQGRMAPISSWARNNRPRGEGSRLNRAKDDQKTAEGGKCGE